MNLTMKHHSPGKDLTMIPLAAAHAYVLLSSGSYVDLLNPHPNSWTDEDLAERLSRTPRWAGSSKWPLPLSVAQHSLMVLAIARMNDPGLCPADQLYILLHDADEGFIGFDAITPLKPVLGANFAQLSKTIMSAVLGRYGARTPQGSAYISYKHADATAATSEAFHIVGWTARQITELLQLTTPILDTDPLKFLHGAEERIAPWEPWEPRRAAQRFLEELNNLTGKVHTPS